VELPKKQAVETTVRSQALQEQEQPGIKGGAVTDSRPPGKRSLHHHVGCAFRTRTGGVARQHGSFEPADEALVIRG